MGDWGTEHLSRTRERMRTRQRIQRKGVQRIQGIRTPKDSWGNEFCGAESIGNGVTRRIKPTADFKAMPLLIYRFNTFLFTNIHGAPTMRQVLAELVMEGGSSFKERELQGQ